MTDHLFPQQLQSYDQSYRQTSINISPPKKQSIYQLSQITHKLSIFPDDQLINLESSIPVLRAAGILTEMSSFQQVKTRLQIQQDQNSLLRQQAKYLYFLWQLINEQQVDTRQLKQIIKFTLFKSKYHLEQILMEIYNSTQRVYEYIDACEFLYTKSYADKTSDISKKTAYNDVSLIDAKIAAYKQNSQYIKHNKSSNIASPILSQSSGQKVPFRQTTNYGTSQFSYTVQLSANQQKQLVSRLYHDDRYQKRQMQKQQIQRKRAQEQMKQCTFKPNTGKRGKSVSQRPKSKSGYDSKIKGFDKAVNRLKAGIQKNKISKQLRDYKPIGENYQKMRNKSINPPKFLDRKKQEQKVLFIISFDLGKYKTNVKIRQGDTQESVAERLCKIYSLKQQFYDQICQIVKTQLQAYYMELYENQTNNYIQNDM